jgi:CHAT domain-containing protein
MIVLDGDLQRIPFEICFANAEDAKDERPLIHRCAISYASSVCALAKEARSGKRTRSIIAGYAPTYRETIETQDTVEDGGVAMLVRSGNYPLPGAAREAQEVVDVFGGDLYDGVLANKATFVETSERYRILHLSMHALPNYADPAFSRLLFSPVAEFNEGQMTTGEIRNLNLNAELVVLSACQTGSGQLRRAEGVQSLARAFALAGASSAVTTLWKVPDESSAQIMVSFYQYLKAGLSKPEALQKAKLDYLNNAKFEAQKHPVYWAGFVLSGNPEPISTHNIIPWWIWLVSGLGVLLLFAYFFKRKSSASV